MQESQPTLLLFFLQQLAGIEQIAHNFQRMNANSTLFSLEVTSVFSASAEVQVVR
jgi:hypothetical protein